MKQNDIILSSCGRYHSTHLAKALFKGGFLKTFFSAGDWKDSFFFDKSIFQFHSGLNFCDRIFTKFQLDRFCELSNWYTFRDSWFDSWVANNLQNYPKIFVGFANASLKSFKMAKTFGSLLCLEAGSMHILEQEELLQEEFKKLKLIPLKISAQNKARMLEEQQLANFIFVPSQHVLKSFVQNNIAEKKLIKIPYGCNTEAFSADKKDLQKKSIKQTKFLSVGMMGVQKGTHLVLEAWKILSRSNNLHKSQLHLIGGLGEDFKQIIKKYSNLPNLVIHGPKPHADLKKIYKDAHVFVHFSIQDGLAMVIGEAMAAGLTVICSQNSGGYELISNQKLGFVLPNFDVEKLYQKMLWCILNPEEVKHIGINASIQAKKYNWQSYETAIINQYQQMLKP